MTDETHEQLEEEDDDDDVGGGLMGIVFVQGRKRRLMCKIWGGNGEEKEDIQG